MYTTKVETGSYSNLYSMTSCLLSYVHYQQMRSLFTTIACTEDFLMRKLPSWK